MPAGGSPRGPLPLGAPHDSARGTRTSARRSRCDTSPGSSAIREPGGPLAPHAARADRRRSRRDTLARWPTRGLRYIPPPTPQPTSGSASGCGAEAGTGRPVLARPGLRRDPRTTPRRGAPREPPGPSSAAAGSTDRPATQQTGHRLPGAAAATAGATTRSAAGRSGPPAGGSPRSLGRGPCPSRAMPRSPEPCCAIPPTRRPSDDAGPDTAPETGPRLRPRRRARHRLSGPQPAEAGRGPWPRRRDLGCPARALAAAGSTTADGARRRRAPPDDPARRGEGGHGRHARSSGHRPESRRVRADRAAPTMSAAPGRSRAPPTPRPTRPLPSGHADPRPALDVITETALEQPAAVVRERDRLLEQ